MDQALSVIFYGGSSLSSVSVSEIYAALAAQGFIFNGSPMWGYVNDEGTWVTDPDTGRKTDGLDLNGVHYRPYAANGSYMWNSTYNKYVIATTHRDSILSYPAYGYGESAETHLRQCAAQHGNWTVFSNCAWFYNYEAPRIEGSQQWDCNGYGTLIRIGLD